MSGSVHSLDSTSDSLSDSSLDFDEDALLAQQEWEESMEQLQKLFSFVLLPMTGKYFGRTFSYWGQSLPTRQSGATKSNSPLNSLCQVPTPWIRESLLPLERSSVVV